MYYAAQAQKQLGGIKPSESGNPEVEWLYHTWLMASEKHGYVVLASDWETLVRRIGRVYRCSSACRAVAQRRRVVKIGRFTTFHVATED